MMPSQSVDSMSKAYDGTWDQADALRDLLRDVGSSNFTVSHCNSDGAWYVVCFADHGDQPAARVFITPDGRIRTDYLVTA